MSPSATTGAGPDVAFGAHTSKIVGDPSVAKEVFGALEAICSATVGPFLSGVSICGGKRGTDEGASGVQIDGKIAAASHGVKDAVGDGVTHHILQTFPAESVGFRTVGE